MLCAFNYQQILFLTSSYQWCSLYNILKKLKWLKRDIPYFWKTMCMLNALENKWSQLKICKFHVPQQLLHLTCKCFCSQCWGDGKNHTFYTQELIGPRIKVSFNFSITVLIYKHLTISAIVKKIKNTEFSFSGFSLQSWSTDWRQQTWDIAHSPTFILVLVGIWVFADQHGNVGVMHYVVTDTSQQSAANGAHTTRANHNHVGLLIIGHLADHFSRVSANTFHFASNLWVKVK